MIQAALLHVLVVLLVKLRGIVVCQSEPGGNKHRQFLAKLRIV